MEKGCGRRWLFFSLVLFSTACSSKQAENPAAAPPLPPARDNAVACLGRIEPVDGITRISARSISGQPSIVARLLVDEGDPVKKGQLVAVLDSKEQLEKAWRQAESRIAVAEMRVAQVRAGAKAGDLAAQQAEIGRIETELANARKQRARQEELHEKGITPASLLDQRRLEVDSLTKLLQQANERLKSLAEIRKVDLDLAEAELSAAKTEALRVRAEYEKSMILAPIAGRVLAVYARSGEEVGAQGIIEVVNTDRMYVIGEVPEADVLKLKVGQRATITGDALSGKIQGVVDKIGSKVTKNRQFPVDPGSFSDSRVVEVKILVEDPASVANLVHAQVTAVIAP
ncbi:MAG: hypothetical protein AUI36_08100 [Cyanobacteria bacterium 13_1_40CM_2_61_4]|nr:MAG: hypothetical protein AUI36_08100 [Cyanobacteria bacterium 13_1_40CM_2_61_4]